MCYSVSGIVHIKEPLLLIGKSSTYSATEGSSHFLSSPLPYMQGRKEMFYLTTHSTHCIYGTYMQYIKTLKCVEFVIK